MPSVLITCTLEGASGLTEDSAINTFSFATTAGTAAALATDAFDAIQQFWQDDTGPSGVALGEYISPAIARTFGSVKMRAFDISTVLGGGSMGSPFAEDTFELADPFGGSEALPAEVAIVLTLRADGWETAPSEAPDGGDAGTAPDRPKSRRSGRLFIGPLAVTAQGEEAVTLRSRPTTNLINTLENAAIKLDAALAADHRWCVWSRKDAVLREVTAVQVDNEWDTMRSRGVGPTSRATTTF